nr:DUF503 domain-containing protein [Desulfobacterales bacterium]
MVIGVGVVVLRLHGNDSLKGKRKIVKKLIARLQQTFNFSVAEIGANDIYQRAEIGFAVVGNDKRTINSKLDKAINFVEDISIAELIDYNMEIIVI